MFEAINKKRNMNEGEGGSKAILDERKRALILFQGQQKSNSGS
jgi:hypothetical protein